MNVLRDIYSKHTPPDEHTDPRLIPSGQSCELQQNSLRQNNCVCVCVCVCVCNSPLVLLAGVGQAGVNASARAEHKLIVPEADTASHTCAGIRASVPGTHRHKVIRTTAGKA